MRHDSGIRSSRYARVVDRIDHLREGGSNDSLIPVGFPGIDRLLGGGLRSGDLAVLAGDSGSGTSSLLVAIALRSAALLASRDSGALHTADEAPVVLPRVLFVTSELTADRAHSRTLGIAARVSSEAMRSGELDDISRARLAATAIELRDHGPVIERIEGGASAIGGILDRSRSIQLLVIDGVEALLESATQNRAGRDDALAEVVLSLKRIALSHDVAMLVVSHVDANLEDRASKRPRLTDLGARGAFGVHADVVLGLFREEVYEQDIGIRGAAEVILLKHREMPPAYADLYFDAELLRFEDVMDPER